MTIDPYHGAPLVHGTTEHIPHNPVDDALNPFPGFEVPEWAQRSRWERIVAGSSWLAMIVAACAVAWLVFIVGAWVLYGLGGWLARIAASFGHG